MYKFKTEPYEHQRDALKKCWNKEAFAIFAEMGTGKTKIALDNACILYNRGKIDRLLVVAPKGAYMNWQIWKFLPMFLTTLKRMYQHGNRPRVLNTEQN